MHKNYNACSEIRQTSSNKAREKREHKLFKNYEIFQGKIRLIEDGKSPRIIDRDAAIEEAVSLGLDVVQIAYNKTDFPRSVCKFLDYNKYIYQLRQKEKQAKKDARANTAVVKEIDFTIRIDTNDMNVKIKKIRALLDDGDKVKILVKLSRRESHLKNMALDVMKMILQQLDDVAELDSPPSAAGNLLSCVIRLRK